MDIFELLSPKEVGTHAEALFHEERTEHKDLHGWFLLQEIAAQSDRESAETNPELQAAVRLEKMVRELPLDISAQALLAGTQRDAFAASYALINPAFDVKTFRGYCDPLEVYDYVKPSAELPAERIRAMRQEAAQTPFVKALNGVYAEYSEYTDEVAFFFESVTGHGSAHSDSHAGWQRRKRRAEWDASRRAGDAGRLFGAENCAPRYDDSSGRLFFHPACFLR